MPAKFEHLTLRHKCGDTRVIEVTEPIFIHFTREAFDAILHAEPELETESSWFRLVKLYPTPDRMKSPCYLEFEMSQGIPRVYGFPQTSDLYRAFHSYEADEEAKSIVYRHRAQ